MSKQTKQSGKRRGSGLIARLLTTFIGIALFIYGVIAFLSPIMPLGAPLAIIGLMMIAVANPAFRPLIRSMRRRWKWFDKLVRLAEPRAGPAVREVIEETEPEEPNEEDETKGGGEPQATQETAENKVK